MNEKQIIPPEILKNIEEARQQLGGKAREAAAADEQIEIDRMISEGSPQPYNEKQGENDD